MQTIKLDIAQKNNVPLLYVKQRDVGHTFQIELYENGTPYAVDENNGFSVWYSGASGDGNYTNIVDETAVFADRNVITVQMIMQMLNEPGGHEMCVVMYGQDNVQKGFWNIPYYVEAIPGADSEGATEYYQAFLDAQKKAEEAADRAEDAADRAEAAGGGSGGGTIIVGINEGNTATHTASEIYDAIQNKQTVVFHHTGRLVDEFVPLKISKPDLAVFSKAGYPTEFDIFDIEIDDSGTISYNTHFSSTLVNQAFEKVKTDLAPVSYLPQTLTEEQKTQARENIGAVDEAYVDNAVKGKAYELIETITLTEDVASVERTQEPDGTPYNFEAVMLECDIAVAASSSYLTADFRMTNGNVPSFYISAGIAAKVVKTNIYVFSLHGKVFGMYSSPVPNTWDVPNGLYPPIFSSLANEFAPINRVRVGGGIALPAGSVIKIWGVRADA